MFAVIVQIEAIEGKEANLVAALDANAAHSRTERGCLKWEWGQDLADQKRFAIYELYEDEAAFDEHKASAHFAEWEIASGPCMASKVAGKFELVNPDFRPVSA
ncbi:MAG: putative quinol monooxygenase [Verrucomicrobiota bacterium]